MEQNFSVFRKGSGGTKAELTEYYAEWGWINFLASIAETKIFDIPGSGLDSIECAKIAKAYKVLTFASQKKDYDDAVRIAYEVKT